MKLDTGIHSDLVELGLVRGMSFMEMGWKANYIEPMTAQRRDDTNIDSTNSVYDAKSRFIRKATTTRRTAHSWGKHNQQRRHRQARLLALLSIWGSPLVW